MGNFWESSKKKNVVKGKNVHIWHDVWHDGTKSKSKGLLEKTEASENSSHTKTPVWMSCVKIITD